LGRKPTTERTDASRNLYLLVALLCYRYFACNHLFTTTQDPAEHGFRHVRFSHDTALLLQRGHMRLRVWIGEENADSHGARLNWLIARSSETCTRPFSAQPELKRAVPVATGQASTTTMKTLKTKATLDGNVEQPTNFHCIGSVALQSFILYLPSLRLRVSDTMPLFAGVSSDTSVCLS
jgi:hypothetical protein